MNAVLAGGQFFAFDEDVLGRLKGCVFVCTHTPGEGFIVGIFVLVGIFFMRWNIVIGGQLFSKSLSGFTSFTAIYSGMEGYLMAAVWLILPLLILTFLLWLMPPWKKLDAVEPQ